MEKISEFEYIFREDEEIILPDTYEWVDATTFEDRCEGIRRIMRGLSLIGGQRVDNGKEKL